MKDQITEKTLIPISLLIVIIGGVSWLSSIHSMSNANASRINELSNREERILQKLESHGESLARIEGYMKAKK